MEKTLIAYYSWTGNNEYLAKDLQKRLNCDILKISEVKKRTGFKTLLDIMFKRKPNIVHLNANLNSYDKIILISPIWAGRVANPLETFLLNQRGNINKYSFISMCTGTDAEDVRSQLTELTRRNPIALQTLKINDVLPNEMKNTMKATNYRINDKDYKFFKKDIDNFLKNI